jgi:hypothetical protein
VGGIVGALAFVALATYAQQRTRAWEAAVQVVVHHGVRAQLHTSPTMNGTRGS